MATAWRRQGYDANNADFARLFPMHEGVKEWQFTPRTAYMLCVALCVLSDEAYDDVERNGGRPITDPGSDEWLLFDRLPRTSWQEDVLWRRQIARAAGDLADDLEPGKWPLPRCVAEELLLHLAIDNADGHVRAHADSDEEFVSLPTRRCDFEWKECGERLFQDSDVLFLYEERLDRIGDHRSCLNKQLRRGDSRPQNWFEPFSDVEPRNPKRGFRR
jgi:hypothetical protein